MKRHPTAYGFMVTVSTTFFVLSVTASAVADVPDGEYHISKYFTDEYRPMIEADSSVFYRAVQSAEDIFAEAADFDLSFVAFARRGSDYRSHETVFNGLPLQSAYRSMLNYMNVTSKRYSGLRSPAAVVGGADGVTEYRTDYSEPFGRRSVGINFTDRGYLFGVRASVNETLGKGWILSAVLSGRTGRDLHVDGVFSSSLNIGISAAKHWNYTHRLSLTALCAPSERGLRYSSTEEAFTLTGDKLYNPSWGYQNGKVRNANVRRNVVPTLVAAYEVELSPRTELNVSAGIDAGVRRYSSLAWFDAQTPMPDNYRYMPSYFGDEAVAAEVEKAWRGNDTRYTQIDWDGLYEINSIGNGESAYAVEDRVERLVDFNLRAAGRSTVGERLTLGYGLRFSFRDSRNYKQMRDLLGGDRIIDIDQYLVDDDMVGSMKQNDLRNPDRVIAEGDRFGYDYSLVGRGVGIFASAEWHADRWRLDVAAEVSDLTTFRRGHYEKELFAGAASYGRSRKIRLAPYAVKVSFGYSFTPRHYVELRAMARGFAPDGEDMFLQTQYNNRTIDDPRLRNVLAAELNYTFLGRAVDLHASLFALRSDNGVEVSHYYDDLAFTYSDMVVSEISLLNIGAEVTAQVRIARNWRASVAASIGRYAYAADPRVTLYSDRDNSLLCDRSVAHMGACRTGSAPQAAATADIVYMNRGWGVRLTANYAGLRYVEPAAMRRTDRVSRQASVSDEIFRRFVDQERLPDAVTLDAAVWKSFRIGESRLVVSLSSRNLTGNRNIVYKGRESLRIGRRNVADKYVYAPFPTRYTYAYPRTFYLSFSYKF